MTDTFSTPDATPELRSSDLEGSLGGELLARAENALDPSDWLSGLGIVRAFRQGHAGGEFDTGGLDVNTGFNTAEQLDQADQVRQADLAAIPEVGIDDAKTQVQQAGLAGRVNLPDQPSIRQPVLDLMLQEGHERADRAAAIARGPQGFLPDALGAVTSIGAGMIDPVNMAAFSIPVLGEARWGKLLASAGDSIFARAGARALQGAAQGAVGTAALQPLTWWLQTRDGQDYTMADALSNVLMGAGMGGAFHAGIGGAGDVVARLRGRPLPGSPADLVSRGLMAGTHVFGGALSEEGITADELAAGVIPQAGGAGDELAAPDRQVVPPHPADVLADLPPAAREDAARVAIADLAADRPVRSAQVLQIAADHDPRIAEGFDAYHGSPHDFDAFDLSKIGTGEGAQAYGHGLYFAENEKVAEDYAGRLVGQPGGYNNEGGHLYKVRINADPDHFLDWDKPLDQQPEGVQEALKKVGIDANDPDLREKIDVANGLRLHPPSGGRVIFPREVPQIKDPGAANFLRAAGIPGIKYLDRGSRGEGEGTRNFVVFNDKDIEITHKNGEPVKLPERAAPVAESAPRIPDLVQSKRARGRAAANPETLSLNEFLAKEGGLRPDPELEAIYGSKRGPFVPGFGPLIRKSGLALDEALSRATQHGYFFDAHDAENGTPGIAGRTSLGLTPNDLLDALDRESRGQKHYKPGHVEATKYDPEQERHVIMGALEHELAAAGENVSAIDPKLLDRTVEIVHREGVPDVLDAYERAIMEDAERYNAVADARHADEQLRDIPGFDDAGAAPGDGGAAGADSGQAGRPDEGRGGANGPQPSSHGARTARAAEDPRWRALADAPAAENTPEALAESKDAEKLPEPASLVPDRSLGALEKAAADAEEAWRQIEPTLSEEERNFVAGALDQLKADKETRDQVIRDGVACLMAAVA